jgi:hypothetical protein
MFIFSDKKWNFIDNPISIIITTLSTPSGSGKLSNFDAKNYFDKHPKQRIKIDNQDRYCLFYALGYKTNNMIKFDLFNLEISRLFHDQAEYKSHIKGGKEPPDHLLSPKQYQRLRKSKPKQRHLANLLIDHIGIDPCLHEYSLEHIKLVQKFYDEQYPGMYRIVVMDDTPTTNPLWCGPLGRKYMVGLYLEANHFDGLKSIAAFYGHEKYCPGMEKLTDLVVEIFIKLYFIDCGKFYKMDTTHDVGCKARCYGCGLVRYGSCTPQTSVNIICYDCDREFFNQQCYDYHIGAMCKRYHRCATCNRVYKDIGEHICGEMYCNVCHVNHDPKRGCFITPIKQDPKKKHTIIMVFDFEVIYVNLFSTIYFV